MRVKFFQKYYSKNSLLFLIKDFHQHRHFEIKNKVRRIPTPVILYPTPNIPNRNESFRNKKDISKAPTAIPARTEVNTAV